MMDAHEEMKIIQNITVAVSKYVPGSLGWIAKQTNLDRDDVWGFVIGNGFASVTMEEALKADDTLYRQLATEIMGYAPDSIEDLDQRIKEAEERKSNLSDQLYSVETDYRQVLSLIDELQSKRARGGK